MIRPKSDTFLLDKANYNEALFFFPTWFGIKIDAPIYFGVVAL